MSTQNTNVVISYQRNRWHARMGAWVPDGQGVEGEPSLEKLLSQLAAAGVTSVRLDLAGVPAADRFSDVHYMRAMRSWLDSILPAVLADWAVSGFHLVAFCWLGGASTGGAVLYGFDGVVEDPEARASDLRDGSTAVASIRIPAVTDQLVSFKCLVEDKAAKLAAQLEKEFNHETV